MNIVLIGSGNVATVLGRKLKKAGQDIIQVFGKDLSHAAILAKELGCGFAIDRKDLFQGADLYMVAISDGALPELANQLNLGDSAIAHTAGAVSIDVLKGVSSAYGVIYPLQSLRKEMSGTREIPFLVDGNSDSSKNFFLGLARQLSGQVMLADDRSRFRLHLAAVIVNNFTNHLYTLTKEFCVSEGVDFKLLMPLIEETAERLHKASPENLQTGPAVRKDMESIRKHLAMLSAYPDIHSLYRSISELIMAYYNKNPTSENGG